MTVAIIDHIGAIIVIALFYTSGLSLTALVSRLIYVFALIIVNRLGV